MKSIQDLARAATAAKLVSDVVTDMAAADRAELQERMASDSMDSLTVKADNGSDLGKITYTPGAVKAEITDEAAFMAWVKANRPDQLRTIVDTEFRKAVVKKAAAEGDAFDPETGEVIPGITVSRSREYISVKPNATAKTMAKLALTDSRVLRLGSAPRAEPMVVDTPSVDWGTELADDPWAESSPW